MNCPICGKELKPTQKFCPACGTRIEQAPEQPAAGYNDMAQPPENYEGTWQPQEEIASAEQQFEQPEQGGFPMDQPVPEAMGGSAAPTAPPKKKISIVTIIVIAGAAALLIAGGVFFAIKLGLFGGGSKDDKSSSDTSQSSQSSQSSSKDDSPAPKAASSPEELVEKFEKALDDNDENAMKELFTPDKRDVQATGAFKMVEAINSAAQSVGATLDYSCQLSNLEYEENNESAKGEMKIAISPLPGITTKVSFVKVDGVWYIDNLLK